MEGIHMRGIHIFVLLTITTLWAAPNPMVLEFNTALSAGESIILSLGDSVDVAIHWGDGTSSNYTTIGEKSHTYSSPGIYTVTISGTLTEFGVTDLNISRDVINAMKKLTRVTSFGDIGLTSLYGAFVYSDNLLEVPQILPSTVTNLAKTFYESEVVSIPNIALWDVGNVTNMSYMFKASLGATSHFNENIGGWDVNNVEDMSGMFAGAESFNQDISSWIVTKVTNMYAMFTMISPKRSQFDCDISSWNVENVTDMSMMFYRASKFNQPIGRWNVHSVTTMRSMFYGNELFNQDIDNWDVDSVLTMESMFYGARAFNQDISSWDVRSVTNMSNMFLNAVTFNQNIDRWNVGSVTDMSQMFVQAVAFNQPLNNWDVSKVTTMESMFYFAQSFNHDISAWDVDSVLDMSYMFSFAENFNQDISSWKVSNVTDMERMFGYAATFNQDIGGWDISKVTSMNNFFIGAVAFNQDISNWDISAVTHMMGLFDPSIELSIPHYDSLLIKWAARAPHTHLGITAGNSKYSPRSAAARQSLIGTFQWTISDSGLLDIPVHSITIIDSITDSNAVVHGEITHVPHVNPSEYGICWNTQGNPSLVSDSIITLDTSRAVGPFFLSIPTLDPNTTYYIRTYVKSSSDTIMGELHSFTTLPLPLSSSVSLPLSSSVSMPSSSSSIQISSSVLLSSRSLISSTVSQPSSHTSTFSSSSHIIIMSSVPESSNAFQVSSSGILSVASSSSSSSVHNDSVQVSSAQNIASLQLFSNQLRSPLSQAVFYQQNSTHIHTAPKGIQSFAVYSIRGEVIISPQPIIHEGIYMPLGVPSGVIIIQYRYE